MRSRLSMVQEKYSIQRGPRSTTLLGVLSPKTSCETYAILKRETCEQPFRRWGKRLSREPYSDGKFYSRKEGSQRRARTIGVRSLRRLYEQSCQGNSASTKGGEAEAGRPHRACHSSKGRSEVLRRSGLRV